MPPTPGAWLAMSVARVTWGFDPIHDNVAARQDLHHAVSDLAQRMLLRFAELEHRLTVRFASVTVVLAGIDLAAIHYLFHV